MKDEKNIKKFDLDDIESIREIASRGYELKVYHPDYGHNVWFWYDKVYLFDEYGDDEGYLRTDDDEEVCDWLNNFSEEDESYYD